jgi:hypothetical protein
VTEIPEGLIQNAVLAADVVAIGPHRTGAEKTRAVVTRAVEFLVGNGLITVVPQDEWPEWLVMDPPFRQPGSTLTSTEGAPR